VTSPVSVFKTIAQDATLTNGAQRATTGPMAKVPWSDVPSITAVSGSGTVGQSRREMQDGGFAALQLSSAVAGTPNGAQASTVVACSGAGIRGARSGAATQPPVDMIVDGRCVEAFRTTQALINGQSTGAYTDEESTFEWPYALNKMPHTITARVDTNPDGATVNTWRLSGWLLPRADGFRDVAAIPRKGTVSSPVALGTTATATTGASNDQTIKAVSFANTDTVAHTVTLYSWDATTIYAFLSIPPGAGVTADRARVTFPSPLSLVGWRWKADAATFVTGILEAA
jgi:hypothetical protein